MKKCKENIKSKKYITIINTSQTLGHLSNQWWADYSEKERKAMWVGGFIISS